MLLCVALWIWFHCEISIPSYIQYNERKQCKATSTQHLQLHTSPLPLGRIISGTERCHIFNVSFQHRPNIIWSLTLKSYMESSRKVIYTVSVLKCWRRVFVISLFTHLKGHFYTYSSCGQVCFYLHYINHHVFIRCAADVGFSLVP